MNKYTEGTVFELYDNDNRKFMVIKNIEINNFIYLLVTPANDTEEKIKIDPTGIFLLRVNKETDELSFEHNKEIITKVINNIFIN